MKLCTPVFFSSMVALVSPTITSVTGVYLAVFAVPTLSYTRNACVSSLPAFQVSSTVATTPSAPTPSTCASEVMTGALFQSSLTVTAFTAEIVPMSTTSSPSTSTGRTA